MKLLELRGTIEPGMRERFLFALKSALKWLQYPAQNVTAILREVNASFEKPLPDAEMKTCFREGGMTYKLKNKTLIEWLDITPQEQKAIGLVKKTPADKNAARNKRRAQKRKRRDKKIMARLADGLSVSETARELGISYNTVNKVRKEGGGAA